MSKFNPEDVVLVYKGTPTFEDGMVGQVIDHDPNDGSYLVADLRDIGKADRDIGVILERYGKWVDAENMEKLEFEKPKDSSGIWFAVGFLGSALAVAGVLVYFYG